MTRKALLISNSQYSDPKLSPLQTPAADVQALQAVLADPRIGDFTVEALVDQPADPTRRQIARFFAQGKPDDLLLLYFTGHGILDEESRLHLATVDTEHEIPEVSGVEASLVANQMKRCRARRQVLILDCCHSGAFAKERTHKGRKSVGDSVGTRATFDGTGHVILTASDMLQYAYEGDAMSGDTTLSVFTHYLVAGLQSGEADLNGDGEVTADELYDYIDRRMKAEVSQGSRSTPLRIVPRQQGEIIVAHNPFALQALPEAVQAVLESPLPYVRVGVVGMLVALLEEADYATIARSTLENLTEDDSKKVSNEALQALGQQIETPSKPLPAQVSKVEVPQIETPAQEILTPNFNTKIDFDWVHIPAGEFLTGGLEGEGDDNESLQHTVYLDDYYIARVPTTNRQYEQFIQATDHWMPDHWENDKIPDGEADHPVVWISWEDAQAFAQWAGVQLPTEAQWEKAARGTDGRTYPWGNAVPTDKLCNFDENVGGTTPVGAYPDGASPYGCLDMAGNVWEWVADLFDKNYYQSSPKRNPTGPKSGSDRVLRGGSWFSLEVGARVGSRGGYYLGNLGNDVGCRLVISSPFGSES